MTIFDSSPHALVAISRHSAELTYYHPGREDAVTRLIMSIDREIHTTNLQAAASLAKKKTFVFKASKPPEEPLKIAFRPLKYVVVYDPIIRDKEIRTPDIVEFAQKVLPVQATLTQHDNVCVFAGQYLFARSSNPTYKGYTRIDGRRDSAANIL
ncbi:unnamed protein product [Nippostrongylus brasiliensis]|uniref:TH1 domain-containing protein n=1 Tax=Nippostrongylus brasiliensis TaxID=27835 RepID=A0A0N4YDY8_NIPBR|nr:unnamed protein product [Nippostrongylus brasiliensis]